MKHPRVLVGLTALLMLLFVGLTACGTAQSSQQAGPAISIAAGAQSPATSSETTTTTLLFSQTTPQQWYESGFYMGYWAGNVETIPGKPKDLPEVFFGGPTPSAPVRTDSQGNPMQKDPSKIKKPLWVFGDEVSVADYTSQIRQAEKDGRPIVFYATSIPDACRALGIEQHGSMDNPLAGSIVIWPSEMGGNEEVEFMGWNPVTGDRVFVASFIFLHMVEATLNLHTTPAGGESSTTYMTAGTSALTTP